MYALVIPKGGITMTDSINKNIDNEELDLEQLEDVSGGYILTRDQIEKNIYIPQEQSTDTLSIKEKLERIDNKLRKMSDMHL